MKRGIDFLICALFAAALSGCTEIQNEISDIANVETTPVASETTKITAVSDTECTTAATYAETTAGTTIVSSDETDGIFSVCYEENTKEFGITYAYPQLADTAENADFINAQVKAFAEEQVRQFREIHEETTQYFWEQWTEDSRSEELSLHNYHMDYTVTRNDAAYFSVTFDGWWYVMETAHPTEEFQSLTIDLQTKETVCLTDLYMVDEAFIQIVQNALAEQFAQWCGDRTEEEISGTLESVLAYFDAAYLQNDRYPVFLTETELGISINTLSHVYGDHFEVRIPYEEIEAFEK